MHISSRTLRLALLRIFEEAGARANEGLAFPEILRSWSHTGLRDSDLRAAVHELLDSGDLRSVERDGMLAFALDASTRGQLRRPGGELQLATLEDETTLMHARLRERALRDPDLRRRAEDFLE